MPFTTNISIGDLIVVVFSLGSVIYNYANYGARIKNCETDIHDLKRGRGLIMGAQSDWPLAVRRCFGMVNHNRYNTDQK